MMSEQSTMPVNPRLYTFLAGQTGKWVITVNKPYIGAAWPSAQRLDIINGDVSPLPTGAAWAIKGVTSNDRYVSHEEKTQLAAKQSALGRPEATHAAIIPIRKNAKWWALTPDDRRAIFEQQSRHNTIGMKYLPAIARRLHHCRDLSVQEPFDFITLFDYEKKDAEAFEELVAALRETEEWEYVDWEIDLRLVRDSA